MNHSRISLSIFAAAAILAMGGAAIQTPPASVPPAPPAPPVQVKPPSQMTDPEKRDRIAEVVANALDKAHGGVKFRTHPILQCDIALTCGEQKFDATLAIQINGNAARLDIKDGSSIVFDGTECWVSPSTAEFEAGEARQRVLTWRNLVIAPFMARDRAFKVSAFRSMMVMGADADAFTIKWTLSSAAEPTHSFIAYAEARSHELSVIGGEKLGGLLGLPDEEKGVHCVVYRDAKTIEEVLLPTSWMLYDWTEAATVRGQQLGSVALTNFRFPALDAVKFDAPDGARNDSEGAPESKPKQSVP